jgi:hypothetical protein
VSRENCDQLSLTYRLKRQPQERHLRFENVRNASYGGRGPNGRHPGRRSICLPVLGVSFGAESGAGGCLVLGATLPINNTAANSRALMSVLVRVDEMPGSVYSAAGFFRYHLREPPQKRVLVLRFRCRAKAGLRLWQSLSELMALEQVQRKLPTQKRTFLGGLLGSLSQVRPAITFPERRCRPFCRRLI